MVVLSSWNVHMYFSSTMSAANKLPIGRFPSKRCVTTFQNNLFLTCQRLNIWLFSYHFALLSVLQQWLLCQPTLFTKKSTQHRKYLCLDWLISFSLFQPGLGTLSAFEEEMLKAGLPDLIKQIQKGIEFVEKNYWWNMNLQLWVLILIDYIETNKKISTVQNYTLVVLNRKNNKKLKQKKYLTWWVHYSRKWDG